MRCWAVREAYEAARDKVSNQTAFKCLIAWPYFDSASADAWRTIRTPHPRHAERRAQKHSVPSFARKKYMKRASDPFHFPLPAAAAPPSYAPLYPYIRTCIFRGSPPPPSFRFIHSTCFKSPLQRRSALTTLTCPRTAVAYIYTLAGCARLLLFPFGAWPGDIKSTTTLLLLLLLLLLLRPPSYQ